MPRKPTLQPSRTRKAQAKDATAVVEAPATGTGGDEQAVLAAAQTRGGPKLELLIAQLQRPQGATVAQLAEALGWQAHSVRGTMAGALKARGHVATSEKTDGVRVYRLPQPAPKGAAS